MTWAREGLRVVLKLYPVSGRGVLRRQRGRHWLMVFDHDPNPDHVQPNRYVTLDEIMPEKIDARAD